MTKRAKILIIPLVFIIAGILFYFLIFKNDIPNFTSFSGKSISQSQSGTSSSLSQINTSIVEKPSEIKEGERCGSYHYQKSSESGSEKLIWFRRGSVTLLVDSIKKVFVLCRDGKVLESKMDAAEGGQEQSQNEYEILKLSDDSLQDLDGDGNIEIVLFEGQCSEGPCLGHYAIYRIGDKEIKKLQTMPAGFSGGALRFEYFGNRFIALADDRCFTYEFGIFLEVLKILELDAAKKWVRVPAKRAMQDYKDIIDKYAQSSRDRLAALSKNAKEDDNLDMLGLNVQILFARALQGEKEEVIMKTYDDLLKQYAPDAIEDPQALGVHCNPRDLLKGLYEEIRTGLINPESALDEI